MELQSHVFRPDSFKANSSPMFWALRSSTTYVYAVVLGWHQSCFPVSLAACFEQELAHDISMHSFLFRTFVLWNVNLSLTITLDTVDKPMEDSGREELQAFRSSTCNTFRMGLLLSSVLACA